MNNKVVKNATWIIVCKALEAILHLVITMITTRYLGPANYGVINYAASLMAFAVPFMHLGVRSILINEFVNAPERKGQTLGTALFLNFVSSFLCVLGVTSFAFVANHDETETIIVCLLYSISLVFQAVEVLQYWFQERLLSKYVSISMLLAYIAMSVYQTIILVLGKDIYWFATSETLKHLAIALLLIFQYRRHGGDRLSVSLPLAGQLLSRGKHYILANLMITIFQQTDKIMLKQMTTDEETGFYAAAVTCAAVANFVYLAIADSMRPVIFQSQLKSKEEFEHNIKLAYAVIGWLSLLQCIAFTVFAPLAIFILYGAEYTPAIPLLQVVVWYTAMAHVGLVRDIWILSQEKQSYMWKMSVFGALANVVLNFLLIPVMGGMGAAIASLISQFVSTIGMCFVFKDLRYVNKLMWQGMNPIILVDVIRSRRKRSE